MMPSLPLELLKKRLGHEIQMCKSRLLHKIEVSDNTFTKFPVEIIVTFENIKALVLKHGLIDEQLTHVFKILITEQYPYEKPNVQWQTSIFHPNIKLPEDGGHVCTRLLDNWCWHSNLLSFIVGIEILLINPNPGSPWDTDSCTLSAEYFNKNQYTSPAILMDERNYAKIENNK
jgi:ubiquitin-conjugating enzyme E2 C